MLKARAIENQCYVCGVNRVGTDGNYLSYSSHSVVINYKGETILSLEDYKEEVRAVKLSRNELNLFRNTFPVWKDQDRFTLY